MKITIAAIGKMKSCPQKEIMQDYLGRLPWKVTIKESEAKKGLSGQKLREAEGKLLLQSLPTNCKKIVLDERGKMLGSIDFAKKLQNFTLDGNSNIAFLIGGADGHSDEVRKSADLLLSLGKMAWPHMLARAMLSEQIYRAYTINIKHPYHRE